MSDSVSRRTRTPPDLKWLLNERASIAGAIEKAAARGRHLTQRVARLQEAMEALNKKAQDVSDARSRHQCALDALELTISLAYSQVRPDAAGVVHAWAGTYGERGALSNFVKQALQSAAPSAVNVRVLIDDAIQNFKLLILTPADRRRVKWAIVNVIRALKAKGLVGPELPHHRGIPASWYWKPPASFADIAAKAQRLANAKAQARNASPTDSNPS